jgi:oligo-1,6-glucosidase
MNREVLSKYDIMTVGEAPGVSLDQALQFVDEDSKALDMFFQFDLMSLDLVSDEVFPMRRAPWKLSEFKSIFSKWDALFANKGWGSLYLDNHDFPRAVSRWGNDSPEYWYRSATMLHTFLMSMRGTPFFYYGEEIGMTNIGFETIGAYRDINTLNKYEIARNRGDDLQEFLDNEKQTSRDNARTPMQWDRTPNAGFSDPEPWISVNKNHLDGINVADQELQENSVLNYFRSMVQLRKKHKTLVYGAYQLIHPENEEVYVFLRTSREERLLVMLSFTTKLSSVEVPALFSEAELLISNDGERANRIQKDTAFSLQPYQACIYKLT